jgi:hypothetical protein
MKYTEVLYTQRTKRPGGKGIEPGYDAGCKLKCVPARLDLYTIKIQKDFETPSHHLLGGTEEIRERF